MGTIKIDSQASSRFLCYHLDPQEQLDSVVKGMLDYNRIPGLLQPLYSQLDDDVFFRYDITSYMSLQDLLQGGIRLRVMIKIMLGIAVALDQSQEYLIPGNAFLLDNESIFVNGRSYDVGLICLPVLRYDSSLSFHGFFLDLLTRNKVNTDQHAQYYPEIINYLNDHRDHLNLRDFSDQLQRYWDEILVAEGTNAQPVRNPEVNPVKRDSQGQSDGTATVSPAYKTEKRGQEDPKSPENRSAPHMIPGPVKEEKKGMLNKLGFGSKPKAPKELKPPKDTKAPKLGRPNIPGQRPEKAETPPRAEKKPSPIGGFIPGKGRPTTPSVPQQGRREPQEPVKVQQQEPAYASAGVDSAAAPGINFGGTVFLSGQNEGTQILDSVQRNPEAAAFRLIRSANGEVVNLDRKDLRIGNERDYSDYCIRSPQVSRQHARLELNGGDCLLTDMGSSNGTYVNGERLTPHEAHALNHGDYIVFGNEEFVFYSR